VSSVLRGDALKRAGDGELELLGAAGFGGAHQRVDFAPRRLAGVEVRGVGGQEAHGHTVARIVARVEGGQKRSRQSSDSVFIARARATAAKTPAYHGYIIS
jgi:hypothetical protein